MNPKLRYLNYHSKEVFELSICGTIKLLLRRTLVRLTKTERRKPNKIQTLIAATFLASTLLISCTNVEDQKTDKPQTTDMSNDEKETAKGEILARIDEIIAGAKNLNIEAAMKPYSNNTDFKIVSPDASVTDFQTMKNTQAEAFKTLASMDFKTIKQDFTFLEKDLVMCTWTGSNEFEMKTGEKMKIEPYVGSMLFRKKNNEWKIVYAHETTAAPVTIK